MRCIVGFICLSACTPIHDQVLLGRDAWTGARSVTVQEREIYRDTDAILVARPIILTNTTEAGYGVLINLRRQDANGPRIMRITALGQTLNYQRLDRLRTHCIDGCQKAEVGVISLSRESFVIASRTGLPLQVWGQRGRAEGPVPAEAFARVLAQVQPAR